MLLPKNDWRQPFFHIAQSKTLEYFILACIISNTVILTLSWYDQPALMMKYFDNINLFFAIVFTFEFIIKFVGYGYRYFQDSWNVFDCTIVTITLLSMILS
jgi:Ion transport protein